MHQSELKIVLEIAFPGQLQIEKIETGVNYTITAKPLKRFFAEAEYFKTICVLPESNQITLEMNVDQAIKLKHAIS